MILSGNAIEEEVRRGSIVIDPFMSGMVNPNSYNYRLGSDLIEVSAGSYSRLDIMSGGFLLMPRRLYLGHTLEKIGSRKFTPSLMGRSSMARLGLFLVVDADHGQLAPAHQWTLELRTIRPLRIYPEMRIGQVSFWLTSDPPEDYPASRYTRSDSPTPSHLGGVHFDPGE